MTRQGPLIVHEGESLNVSGQLVDFAGAPILKAGLVAILGPAAWCAGVSGAAVIAEAMACFPSPNQPFRPER